MKVFFHIQMLKSNFPLFYVIHYYNHTFYKRYLTCYTYIPLKLLNTKANYAGVKKIRRQKYLRKQLHLFQYEELYF